MTKNYVFEEFRVCKDHNDNYSISNFGSVLRIKKSPGTYKNRKINPYVDTHGYPVVTLYKDGYKKYYLVHRLVAYYFIGLCPEDKEVNHKDGDKENPYFNNLEYVTSKENARHAYKIGLRNNVGENHERCKLTNEIVRDIRRDFKSKVSAIDLSKKYGLMKAHIWKIVHYKLWKHI